MTIRTAAARLPILLIVFALLALMVGCGHGASSPGSPPLNVMQRHPTMTGIAAGTATHHLLKESAARKKANGQPLNFAEKHPTLSGIAVGVATHHVIKKMTPHN